MLKIVPRTVYQAIQIRIFEEYTFIKPGDMPLVLKGSIFKNNRELMSTIVNKEI